MSDQPPAQPPAGRSGRNPFVTALLIFIGIILLLPGLCSLIFVAAAVSQRGLFDAGRSIEPIIWLLWGICLLIGLGGVALIAFAVRRRRGLP
jgi:hypothetical protein